MGIIIWSFLVLVLILFIVVYNYKDRTIQNRIDNMRSNDNFNDTSYAFLKTLFGNKTVEGNRNKGKINIKQTINSIKQNKTVRSIIGGTRNLANVIAKQSKNAGKYSKDIFESQRRALLAQQQRDREMAAKRLQRQRDFVRSKISLTNNNISKLNNNANEFNRQLQYITDTKNRAAGISTSLTNNGLIIPKQYNEVVDSLFRSSSNISSSKNSNLRQVKRITPTLKTTNKLFKPSVPGLAIPFATRLPDKVNASIAENQLYSKINKQIDDIIRASLVTNYGFPNDFNMRTVHFAYVLHSSIERSNKNLIDRIATIQKKFNAENWEITNPQDMYFVLNEMAKYSKTQRPTKLRGFMKYVITAFNKNGMENVTKLKNTITTLQSIGLKLSDANNVSILQYINRFNRLFIYINSPEFPAILTEYAKFGLNANSDLLTFLSDCNRFNIKESIKTRRIRFKNFAAIVNPYSISYKNFSTFIGKCLENSFFRPATSSSPNDVNNPNFDGGLYAFMQRINTFKKGSTDDILTRIDYVKTKLREVGINSFKTYNDMISYIEDKVVIKSMDMDTFITLFTKYYNTRKYSLDGTPEDIKKNGELFNKHYPTLDNEIPTTITFDNAINNYINVFKDPLKFTKEQGYCFGAFINSMLNVSKRYIIQLKEEIPPENRVILYTEHSVYRDGFTERSSLSDYNSVQDPLSGIMYLYNSFIGYLTNWSPLYVKEGASNMDSGNPTAGYLQLLASLGVTDTTKPIVVDTNGTTVIGEKGFFAYIGQKYKVNTFADVQKVLAFFKSINMPLSELGNTLLILQGFGVNASNFDFFIQNVSALNIGNFNSFKLILPKLIQFGVNMSNLEKFREVAVKFKVNMSSTKVNASDDGTNSMINKLLDILLKYKITYTLSKYDRCYTKFTNMVFNLASDGVYAEQFLQIAEPFLKALNLENEQSQIDSANQSEEAYDKNLRDLIIRRTNFFVKENDITPYGNMECANINTLNVYDSTLNIKTDWNSNKQYDRMLALTNRPDAADASHYYQHRMNESGKIQTGDNFKYNLYKNIKLSSSNNLTYEHYCYLIKFLDDIQYSNLKNDAVLPNDKLSRQFMSSLLAKILDKLDLLSQNTKFIPGTSTESMNANIKLYNDVLDPLNMILLFPHYTLYLLTRYATSLVSDNCRKPGEITRAIADTPISEVTVPATPSGTTR